MANRFEYEASVPDALSFAGGFISEKNMNISVLISAVQRSKWLNSTWRLSKSDRDVHNQQQGHMPPHMPTGQPYPLLVAGMPPMNHSAMHTAATDAPFAHQGYPPHSYPPSAAPMQVPEYVSEGSVAISPTQNHGDRTREHISGRRGNSKSSNGSPNVSPTAVRTPAHKKKHEAPKNAKVQSKPPFEEALEETDAIDSRGPPTPESQRSVGSFVKARVSLPTVTPEHVRKTAKQASAKRQSSYVAGKDDEHESVHKPAGDVSDSPKSRIKGSKDKKKDQTASEANDAPKTGMPERESLAPQAKASTALAPKEPGRTAVTAGEGKLAAKPAARGHQSTSSIFTEDQIKGRKQAWDRIPMPLDPRKTNKSTAADADGSNDRLSKEDLLKMQTAGTLTRKSLPNPLDDN